MHRSWLFVPGDSERKLARAADSGADALILDLEDSVAAERRPQARALVAEYLRDAADDAGAPGSPGPALWVRINAMASGEATADLAAALGGPVRGVVLPKPRGAADAVALDHALSNGEARAGLAPGSVSILPIATELPAACFRLHEYIGATPRLAGLSWGAEDLAAGVGASASRNEDGRWLPTYELVRSLCLLAARAAGVAPIDTVFTDYRDLDALTASASAARRDGFTGMLAIHPAQVAAINEAFTPSADEVRRAGRVVAAFRAQPGAGVIGLDGEMLDRPHLRQAEALLALARAAGLEPEQGRGPP